MPKRPLESEESDDDFDVEALVQIAHKQSVNQSSETSTEQSDQTSEAQSKKTAKLLAKQPTNQSVNSFASAPKAPQIFKKQNGAFQLSINQIDSGLPKPSNAAQLIAEANQQANKQAIRQAKTQTAGAGWFNMPAPVLTPELKRDLKLMNMRAFIDPKRFYKRSERKANQYPKYFQQGTVIASAAEFYSARGDKAETKGSMADAIQATGKDYLKRKYNEIQSSRARKPFKSAKKQKKR